jgi:hypothetical protein
MLVHLQQGCTTHFLRCSRRVHDDGRERYVRSLRPRNLSVPSYRPMHTTGYTGNVLQ